MWFGRQPNGCIQTIFSTPLSINSIISPGRSQPSPVWLPTETNDAVFLDNSIIFSGALNLLLFLSSFT